MELKFSPEDAKLLKSAIRASLHYAVVSESSSDEFTHIVVSVGYGRNWVRGSKLAVFNMTTKKWELT